VDRGLGIAEGSYGCKIREATIETPVFPNDRDVSVLTERGSARFASPPAAGVVRVPGYLIAGHGPYAWGATLPRPAVTPKRCKLCFSKSSS
jgi:methylthioribulose-1-phosphate dehydratase